MLKRDLMKGVDAHCHLDFEQFDNDRSEVIDRSKDKLEFIVNAGANLKHNKNALKLANSYPDFIKANLGLHPVYTNSFGDINKVKKQVQENSPAAIGEIGMDYHHVQKKDTRKKQEEVFKEMLNLAEKEGQPVVLHTRDAEKQVLKILENYSLENVFLHCFNGSLDLCRNALDRNYFIGITTQVLYSNHVKNIAEVLDLSNMVLETDSPYLYRGDRNEPVNVMESAKEIAEIKNIEKKKVLSQTVENSKILFD